MFLIYPKFAARKEITPIDLDRSEEEELDRDNDPDRSRKNDEQPNGERTNSGETGSGNSDVVMDDRAAFFAQPGIMIGKFQLATESNCEILN